MQSVTEIQQSLRSEYPEIWDVIFDYQKHALESIERGIASHPRGSVEQKKLLAAYGATIRSGAIDYTNKVGVRFSLHVEEDFIEKALSSTNMFDHSGKYLGVKQGSVHAIRISDDFHSVDFCFCSIEEARGLVTSEMFILFYREDVSDWQLLTYLKELRDYYGGSWSREMVTQLIEQGLLFNKESLSYEKNN